MEIPTPALDNVKIEPFTPCLTGEITAAHLVEGTSTLSIVGKLLTGLNEGGVGVTFNLKNPHSRYRSASVSGRLQDTAGELLKLELGRTFTLARYWEIVSLRLDSPYPGLHFSIDFFSELQVPALTIQEEGIDLIDGCSVDRANEQIIEGFESYFRLLGARSNA